MIFAQVSQMYLWKIHGNGSLANLPCGHCSYFSSQVLRFLTWIASVRRFPKGQRGTWICLLSRHAGFFGLLYTAPPETRALRENRSLFHHVCFGCLRKGVDCIKADSSGASGLGEGSVFRGPGQSRERPLHQTPLMESPVPVNTRHHLSRL